MPWDDEDNIKIKDIIQNNPFICPICNSDDCVPAHYGDNSNVLFIGEQPGEDELKYGKPFVGRTGGLLNSELQRLGHSLYQFRLCNLWIHPAPSNKKSEHYKNCFERSIKLVLEEAKNKKLVVLIGSDTVKYFCNEKVSEWNGLLVKSPYLNNPYILAMIQPASAFHGGIGEARFGIERFVHYLEEINGK